MSFSAGASGVPAPEYQWLRDGRPLPGETNSILTRRNVGLDAAGFYEVIVSNNQGVARSPIVSLSVDQLIAQTESVDLSFHPGRGAGQDYSPGVSSIFLLPGGELLVKGHVLQCNTACITFAHPGDAINCCTS